MIALGYWQPSVRSEIQHSATDFTLCSRSAAGLLALKNSSAGFGLVALAGLVDQQAKARPAPHPLAPKASHFPAKAKKLIFVHMNGSMSTPRHLRLQAEADRGPRQARPRRRHPHEVPKFELQTGTARPARGSPNCLPNLAKLGDELLLAPRASHRHAGPPASRRATAHRQRERRPHAAEHRVPGCSTASALRRQDLRGYLTINPPPNFGGAVNFGSAFLPAHFQGHAHQRPRLPAQSQAPQTATVAPAQASSICFRSMNRDLAEAVGRARTQVEGVIESYELAFRMEGKVAGPARRFKGAAEA